MNKLKFQASSLAKTPLTEEELKAIIDGQIKITTTCTCSFTYNDGSTSTTSVEAENQETCASKCEAACSKNERCIDSSFTYTAQG